MFLGIYDIDEYVAIPAATHRFSSGAAYQPTALTYSIYEEGGTTGLDEDVDMTPASPFDAITGAYYSRRQLTAAAGFERDKTYLVAVKATVDSVAAVELHVFQIRQKQTGDSYARLGAPAGASVSADIAALIIAVNDINNTINRTLGDHGTVSQAAMKISAVDGTAFVDFGLPAVLTNGVAQKAKLTITDSAGKKLVGYIKAAGTGETYGSNIVFNGDMEDGDPPSGWGLACGGSLSSAADGFSGNCLQITETGGGHPYAYRTISGGKGKLFKWVSGYVKAGTGASYRMYWANLANSVGWSSTQTASGSWVNKPNGFCFTSPHETAANLILRNMAAAGSGQTIFFDEVSIQQILTPSATGVTITSTPDGSTYNWESQESGFNYNDASGYSYTIETLPSSVWMHPVRTLSSFGTLVSDIATAVWGHATRTLTAISDSSGVTTLLSRIGSALTITSGKVTVGTNDDKTGYSLSSSQSFNLTGNITGNLSGSVGSVSGAVGSVTGNVGGNVAGSVNSVTNGVTVTTNNDKTGYALSAAGLAAIWDRLTSALTTAGSIGKLLVDNINATIASRSTYAGGDTPGTTTLLSRISAALSFTGGNVHAHVKAKDNLDFGALEKASLNAATPSVTVSDKTGFSLATPPPTAAQVRSEMDSNSTKLANLDAAVSSRASQVSLDAIPTNPLATNDARLDTLDVAISTRLAGDDYDAPDNAGIAAIRDTDVPALQSSISALDFPSVTTELENVVEGLGGIEAALQAARIPYGKVWEYTCTNSATGMPIQGVKIVASTDEAGLNAVAEGYTDAFGVARLYLVPGTYYIWRFKPGFNPVNPDVEVVE